MTLSPFEAMQQAVDIVNGSAHPTNKIAASLTGVDQYDRPYSVAMTNYWPGPIRDRLGEGVRIGNASGTIHAETACLLTAPRTEGAHLFVTDPFCPNCAKNMAEAGIARVFIDHKGFAKDFAARRDDAFRTMSMRICEKAGIEIVEINRRDSRLQPIITIDRPFAPAEDRPVTMTPVETGLERQTLKMAVGDVQKTSRRRFAAAIAQADSKQSFIMIAFAQPAAGFSYDDDAGELNDAYGKYSFMLEPLNRLLMNAARQGLKLMDGHIYVSQTPTSREQVNLVGAGLSRLAIGDSGQGRDADSLEALALMKQHGLLQDAPLEAVVL